MKKYLATLGLLIVSAGFIYFQGTSTPAYAANTANGQSYVTYDNLFIQDTVPMPDTAKHKMKMKHKMKKDSTWRKDSIPH